MRNLLIATTGFLAAGAVVVALLLALPRTTNVTVTQATPNMTAMRQTAQGGTRMMASASIPATRKLTIRHVLKGCHAWSNGTTTGPMMRLNLKPGQKLSILDQDIDAHKMLQFSGPMHLRLGGPMMMNRGITLAFTKKGVYRLGTKTVEMPGGGMDVKTAGPDNELRLVVTVA